MKDKKIKLGDFGVARVLSKTNSIADTITGTPVYISPEMLEFNDEHDASKGYGFSSDIWSLGVLLYEMITKEMPFDGDDIKGLFKNIKGG
jgi:NIMA (never in mitosis gene a)-related kinase